MFVVAAACVANGEASPTPGTTHESPIAASCADQQQPGTTCKDSGIEQTIRQAANKAIKACMASSGGDAGSTQAAATDAAGSGSAPDCRHTVVWKIKAHYDYQFTKRVKDEAEDGDKTGWATYVRKFVVLAGTTATLVDESTYGKANTAIGTDFTTGLMDVFWPRSDRNPLNERLLLMEAHRRDIIDRVEARLSEKAMRYPLEAVLADMERYNQAGTEDVAEAL